MRGEKAQKREEKADEVQKAENVCGEIHTAGVRDSRPITNLLQQPIRTDD